MNVKPIWQSKVFWFNILALGMALFPQTKAWIAANPETTASVWAAVNVLLRFATSGKISLSGAGETDEGAGTGSGMYPCWLLGITAAGLSCLAVLPSCSQAQLSAAKSIPIRTTIYTDYGIASYSSKGGLVLAVDRRSGK